MLVGRVCVLKQHPLDVRKIKNVVQHPSFLFDGTEKVLCCTSAFDRNDPQNIYLFKDVSQEAMLSLLTLPHEQSP